MVDMLIGCNTINNMKLEVYALSEIYHIQATQTKVVFLVQEREIHNKMGIVCYFSRTQDHAWYCIQYTQRG